MATDVFGSKSVTDVSAPMILDCLRRVEARGNYETARRLRAIDAFHGQTTTWIALKLLALLAQRPGGIRHVTWEEFDFEDAGWSVPADRMKMRRSHRVPLPRQGLSLREELKPPTGSGHYLFPSLRTVQSP